MAQIPPLSIDDAPAEVRATLEPLRAPGGKVLNFYTTLARAPAALDGFLALKRTLASGALAPAQRERVAVLVAQRNGCEYCLSAHAGVLRRLGASEADLAAARRGASDDARTQSLLRLAQALLAPAESSPTEALLAARAQGVTDAEALEVAAHVALNVFSNAVNLLAGTELDLPRVPLAETAPAQ